MKRSTMRKFAMVVAIVVVATMANQPVQAVEPERVLLRDE